MARVEQQENKMGIMPINKLLVSMALPMIFSMIMEGIYNLMDTFWLARVDTQALAAMAICGPVLNMMVALGVGTGVGINALLSRSLGEKNYDKANKAAANGIFIGVILTVLFMLFGMFGSRMYMNLQTADPVVIEYGVTYLQINSIFSIGVFAQLIFEKVLQSTGNTKYLVLTQGLGAVINLALDPIMIFGLFGFPKLGVAGAALSNVIGQIVGGGVAIFLTKYKTKEVTIHLADLKPDPAITKEILRVGVPSMIMMTVGSIMTFSLNIIIGGFNIPDALAFVGVYFKLQGVLFMPIWGITGAMVPIVAYNYGAQNKYRIKEVIKLSLLYTTIVMAFATIAFRFFPEIVLSLFKPTQIMMDIGVIGLKTISLGYLVAGYCIICSSVFQSLGMGTLSMISSISRQMIVLVPVAMLLAKTGVIHYVWWAFPISEIVAMLVSSYFLARILKDKINVLPDEPPVITQPIHIDDMQEQVVF